MALRSLADRFEVRAVYDQVAHRAQAAAAEWDAAAVDSFRQLAAREDVDAVLVLDRQWFGVLPALAAWDLGKAVYLGGDLNWTPEDAARICQRTNRSAAMVMAELPRRHAPATVRLKELMATRLGPPQLVFCHHRLPLSGAGPRPGPSGACRTVTQELVELVDWVCYVVGRPPGWVTGNMYQGGEGPCQKDYQMMSLDFSQGSCPGDGPVAQVSCGRYIPGRWGEAISYRPLAALQVSCLQGIAFVDLPATLVWFDEAGRHQESLESEPPVGQQLLRRFHQAATESAPHAGNLEEICQAWEIVDRARRSYHEGCRLPCAASKTPG